MYPLRLIACLVFTYFGLSESSSVNCEYKKDYHFSMRKYYYQCNAMNDPNITSLESAQIESITGNHLKKKKKVYNDNHVTEFLITRKTVNYFPKNLGAFFKNLKIVEINVCHLKEIHQSDLIGLNKLEALDLSSNDLKIIELGLFDNNLELQSIKLDDNKLIHIDPDVFDNLPKLEKLNLFKSGCSFPLVPYRSVPSTIKEVKDRCVNLEHLAPEKKAKYIESEEFKKQQQLDLSTRNNTITCEFDLCKVKYNPPITTPELAQINTIFQINDKYEVKELTPRDDISRFEAVNHLINYFPRGLEKIFTNLQHISIQNCQLKEIHQSDLKPYTHLNSISLDDNLIEVIEDGLFDFNKELTEIYMSYNKIVHIGADAFSNLPRLQTLYLHGIPCLDSAHIKGCKDRYGLDTAIDNLRRYCLNPNYLDSKTKADV